MPDALSVVPLNLGFTADGKVSGSSPENGCSVLGVWGPGIASTLFALDMSLKGCRYPRLNRRYSGSLIADVSKQIATLMLQSVEIPLPGDQARMYDIKATLRR
jgi:hypothetical protein